MLDNIKIILIQTFHPGNIGAAARAMKNMGLSQLILVNPVDFPSEEATARAGQATDILDKATIVNTLEEAIQDCALVVATSARDRSITLPALTAQQAGLKLVNECQQSPVALVFGRERMGLHNSDIQQCHMQVNINASADYPVLNIAQAIQILCYEIFQSSSSIPRDTDKEIFPVNQELEYFYQQWESTLQESGFLQDSSSNQAMTIFRALFRRARPNKKELKLLIGATNSLKNN